MLSRFVHTWRRVKVRADHKRLHSVSTSIFLTKTWVQTVSLFGNLKSASSLVGKRTRVVGLNCLVFHYEKEQSTTKHQ